MSRTFFFSDAHLGGSSIESETIKVEKLLGFLDHVSKKGERLFIVGDLFDVWFEYRTVIPKGYTRILCAILRLSDLGIEMHYITGNHDFWMRDYLNKEFGMIMHSDEVDFTTAEKRFYLFHGDGLAKDDVGYRMLKRVFRNKLSIFLYSWIHPDLAVPFAKWVSSFSRKHSDQETPPSDEQYIQRALEKFEEGFDYAIFGHLHSPRYRQYGEKVVINLGDWIEHFTYAEFDGENLSLLAWH